MRCLVCQTEKVTARSLSAHIQHQHGLSTEGYTVKYILSGVEPKCHLCDQRPRYTSFTFKMYCKGHALVAETEAGKQKKRKQMDHSDIQKIRSFFVDEGIEFSEPESGVFQVKGKNIQVRYANSKDLKIGYPKFGYSGTNTKHLYEISKKLEDEGSRVIWWHDFELNIPRKNNVIKSYILCACGKIKNRVYARDCIVKSMTSAETKTFLNDNCFYGYRSASLNVGLYLKKDIGELKKDTLVMMWSIGHAFFGKKMYDMEIIRASTLLNTQVVGGQSKLFSHINKIPAVSCGGNLVTWNSLCFYVDYDHNDGKSLPVIGFKFLNYSKGGFMNINLETNESFNRKPMQHKQVMDWMRDGKVISTPMAGVKVFIYCRDGNYSKFGI